MPHTPEHKKKRKLLKRGVPVDVGPATLTLQEKPGDRTQEEIFGDYLAQLRRKRTQTTERILPERLRLQEEAFEDKFKKQARDLEEEFFPETPTQQPTPETPKAAPVGLFAEQLQRTNKIFKEQGFLAALSETIFPSEVGGKPLVAGTVPLAFGPGQVGLLTQALIQTKGATLTITQTASKLASGKEVASITTQKAVQALGGGTSKVNLLFEAAKNLGPQSTKLLLTKSAWLKVGAAVGGLSATSGVMTWMASDNIMQGTSIMTRDLSFAVRSGAVSKEDALSLLEEAQEWKNRAERFVKINSKVNPVLWPFGKILLTNAKVAQAQLDLQKQNILMGSIE